MTERESEISSMDTIQMRRVDKGERFIGFAVADMVAETDIGLPHP